MIGEINKGFYCSGSYYASNKEGCILFESECNTQCGKYHRKWPTPEQFLEEFGEEYPDDAAVYELIETPEKGFDDKPKPFFWNTSEYRNTRLLFPESLIICACTPWGKPPDNWRPQN